MASCVPVTVNLAVESLPALVIVTTLPLRVAVDPPPAKAPSIVRFPALLRLSPLVMASTSFKFCVVAIPSGSPPEVESLVIQK